MANEGVSQSPSYSPFTALCLRTYSLVRKSGILEQPLPKRLFQESYFFYKRYFEDPFFHFARRYPHAFSDGVILDVGANCGYTAMVFSAAATPPFRVYAFEPDQSNLELLHSLVARKSLKGKISVIGAAVGASPGSIQLWKNQNHHADHRIATKSFVESATPQAEQLSSVQMVSIDSFLDQECPQQPVSFIKIDVQGFEPPVCEGMVKTIERNPNLTVAVEYSPLQIEELGFSSVGLLDFFISRGFSWYFLERDGNLQPFSKEKLEVIVRTRGYTDLLASKSASFRETSKRYPS